jgi:outer membrane protein assembly factor BamB
VLKFLWSLAIIVLVAAPAAAQNSIPDLRGTWKGTSESVVWGAGNHHHLPGRPQSAEPRFHSAQFTLKVTKQQGRRFYGVWSSPGGSEILLGVISRDGTIYAADDDGYTTAKMLDSGQVELCYLHSGADSRIASCAVMKKQ